MQQQLRFDGGSGGGGGGGTVAFLMPDTGSTRYELHDRPGFEKKLKELCPDCKPLYNNADGSADKQQQQFNSAVAQGAKVIVLDPVDSAAAAVAGQLRQGQGVKVIAYDRPIPDTKVDYYVSFDNEDIGKQIAQSLIEKVKASRVPPGAGVLIVNGSPTDAAAGLIKKGIHAGVDNSGVPVLAEYDTIEWKPENAQKWVAGQITSSARKIVGVVAANDGTAGGAIAAFKAAGVNPIRRSAATTPTVAGLQLIIAGDQYNTISKPSEIVGGAAAESPTAAQGREARGETSSSTRRPSCSHRRWSPRRTSRPRSSTRTSHRLRAVHRGVRGGLHEAGT